LWGGMGFVLVRVFGIGDSVVRNSDNPQSTTTRSNKPL